MPFQSASITCGVGKAAGGPIIEEGGFRGAEVGTIAVEGVAGCGGLGSGLGRQVRAFQEERRSGWAMPCLWTGSRSGPASKDGRT